MVLPARSSNGQSIPQQHKTPDFGNAAGGYTYEFRKYKSKLFLKYVFCLSFGKHY